MQHPPTGALESAGHANEPSSDKEDGPSGQPSFVAVSTVVAFLAFAVTYALAGEPAAAIVFWAAFVGLVLLLPLISMWYRRARRARQEDIRIAATLAAELAVQRAREEMSRDA